MWWCGTWPRGGTRRSPRRRADDSHCGHQCIHNLAVVPDLRLRLSGTTAVLWPAPSILTINMKWMGRRGVLNYYPRDFKTERCWELTDEISTFGRCRKLCAGAGRAGLRARRQDRRPQRPIRRLCRLRRQVLGRSRQDGDRGFWRRSARQEDRDDHRRSPEQAGSRELDRAALVRRRERRHDHGADDLLGRACNPRALQGKEEDRHRRGRRDLAPHG